MAIFPLIKTDDVVRVGDKIRIYVSDSFASKDEAAISSVTIEPEAGEGLISVYDTKAKNWYLDWVYSGTDRQVVITCEVATDGLPTQVTLTLDVVTEANDPVFSSDADLRRLESDVDRFLPEGRSSFLYAHRRAKTAMLDWLNESGHRLYSGEKITAAAFVDADEVRKWSEMLAMKMIYSDNSNSLGDYFSVKATEYDEKARDARNRAVLKLDLNLDGQVDLGEQIRVQTLRLKRK